MLPDSTVVLRYRTSDHRRATMVVVEWMEQQRVLQSSSASVAKASNQESVYAQVHVDARPIAWIEYTKQNAGSTRLSA